MNRRAPILETTQRLLANRGDLTLREVADGAEVGFDWLNKFAQGAIRHPSVVRVQALHDFLTDRQRAA